MQVLGRYGIFPGFGAVFVGAGHGCVAGDEVSAILAV